VFTSTSLPIVGTQGNPGLLDLAHVGRLVVPEFQRPFVWSHQRILALIRSVARNWPAGSLLVMEGSRGFPSRTLEKVNAGAAQDPEYSVLDGQQRLTALYATLHGLHPRHTYFVNLRAIVHRGSVDEDDFDVLSSRKWRDSHPTVAHEAQAGFIPVEALASDALFFGWLGHLPATENRDDYIEARKNELGGLATYQFPVSIVSRHAPLEVLTAVFVTINQQGQRLTVFDLMVAKSWVDPVSSPPGYDLRAVWTVATGRDPRYSASHQRIANFDIDEVAPLRLVKLLDATTGGVGNAEIIKLDGAVVRTHFKSALDALAKTLELLESRCSVVPESLPSHAGILAIAYVLAREPAANQDATKAAKLTRWFWASTFLQRYGRGGTNTLVVNDAKELEGWVLGTEAEPSWITNFWTSFDRLTLLETQATNEVLLRGLVTLQSHSGACDWITGEEIRTLGRSPEPNATTPVSRLDAHHIFPTDNPLPGTGGTLATGEPIPPEVDLILNRVLVRASTNRTLQATPPSALTGRGITLAEVETHLIYGASLNSWDDFVRRRIDDVEAAVRVVLP
jgi:hypothetical protein